MYITDLQDSDLEIAIKVVIVGNGAVGKSSMIQRYCRGVFTKSYKKTIGVDFLEKHMRIMSEDVRLMLWDTAGQEEFDAITKAYYRGAQACVVAFSTTDRASFDAIKKWKRKVEDECGGSSIPMVLVQNKIDLMHQSVVTNEEVDALAKECHMRLYRTSVKEDINICNVFQHLAENYVNQVKSSVFLSRRPVDDADTAPSSFLKIGERVGGGGRNGGIGGGSNYHYSTPQEYLDNPMFASLNSGRGSKYWLAKERTIVLRPLTQLTKKKNLHKKLPMKTGCRVL